jgi:von Willebrand factor type A domain
MKRSYSRFFRLGLPFLLLIIIPNRTCGAEPTVQIRSPKDGSQITQEQDYLLVSGKVASGATRSPNVDIFLVLDVSGSTALYAGVDFSEFSQLPNFYVSRRMTRGRIDSNCSGRPGSHNLRNSILAAEVVASRRLLSQVNPETTRVGVITFSDDAWLRQPLTHDFEQVRSALDLIYKRGPYGLTNMVDAIDLATEELLGKGESEKYLDSIKMVLFLTDGFPTLPSADCRSGKQADEDLTINAAQKAGMAGISVHVIALGEEALSKPRAAVGIARESGGTYTAVTRPADVLVVVDKVSAVGVDFLHVTNETIGQKALRSRLAADGFFASAVPVMEGLNRLQVLARASDGSVGRDTITVHYQPGKERSLALEVFLENEKRSLDLEVSLEKEKRLKLEVERLGKSPDQIQKDIDRNREESLKANSNSSRTDR